jgi:hypothetical protein
MAVGSHIAAMPPKKLGLERLKSILANRRPAGTCKGEPSVNPCLLIVLLSIVVVPFSRTVAAASFNPLAVGAQDVAASDQMLIGDWQVKMVIPGVVPFEETVRVRRGTSGRLEATITIPAFIVPVPVKSVTMHGSQVNLDWGGGKLIGTLQPDGKIRGTVVVNPGQSGTAEWTRLATATQLAAGSSGTDSAGSSGTPMHMSGAASSKLIASAPLPVTSLWAKYVRQPAIVRLAFTVRADGTTTDIVDVDPTSHPDGSAAANGLVNPSIDAVKSWHYKPYSVNGKLTSFRTTVQFKWGTDVPNFVTAVYQ